MDLAHLRTQLRLASEQMTLATHDRDPEVRAAKAETAIRTIIAMWHEVNDAIAARDAAADAAAQARTACRERLYPRAQPCVHDDDGQEELGMGEPSAVPAPWKSPD